MANERRLIDANALMAYKHNHDYELVSRMGCVDKGMFTDGIEHGINIQKTVDAVEVVRCKDCKHKGWIQEPCHGKSVDFCHVWDSCVNNPDKCFCSYGERRTDGRVH